MTDAEKRGQHRSWYVDELVSYKSFFPFLFSIIVLLRGEGDDDDGDDDDNDDDDNDANTKGEK